jgi:hypothetical protein
MRGVITTRDILANARLIWREFGLGCLLRCLWVCLDGRETTFLDVALRESRRP